MGQSACPRFFCILRILLHSAVQELLKFAASHIPLSLRLFSVAYFITVPRGRIPQPGLLISMLYYWQWFAGPGALRACTPAPDDLKLTGFGRCQMLEHFTKSCNHVGIEKFLVKQPMRFEPRAYIPWRRVLREYSTGE